MIKVMEHSFLKMPITAMPVGTEGEEGELPVFNNTHLVRQATEEEQESNVLKIKALGENEVLSEEKGLFS